MAAGKGKKGISVYIPPFLFCIVMVVLVLLQDRGAEPVPARVLEPSEPLTLTDQAIENYLYSDGFTLSGETVLDADGKAAATLTVHKGEDSKIDSMTLSFPLPTFIETQNSSALTSLKANHDAAAQKGETLFLALFDAIAATDGRVDARRDGALDKLRQAMDTGKAATQSANSWRFSFSVEPGALQSTVTILFTLVK